MVKYPLIDFTVNPMEIVRVGFIGLGSRGLAAIERFTHIEGARIAAICDVEKDALSRASGLLDYSRGVSEYSGNDAWKRLCENPSLDLVYICTDWLSHAEIACYAMERGKHVAVEVPAATSVEEAVNLVRTAEKTQRHCLMLENCIYDVFEDTTCNMVKAGVFGDVYHAEGGYIHNLRYLNEWREASIRFAKATTIRPMVLARSAVFWRLIVRIHYIALYLQPILQLEVIIPSR